MSVARRMLAKHARDVKLSVERAESWLPKQAFVLSGKYSGRLGCADGCNSDAESRMFRPLDDLEFVG